MNWWKRFKINLAKKILNDNAPTGEFIAYINKDEERKLKKLGGLGKPVNETGIKSFLSFSDFNPFKVAQKALKSKSENFLDSSTSAKAIASEYRLTL